MSRVGVLGAAALFLWVTPALAETDWSQAQPVTVIATNYKFAPKRLTFKRGVAYRLHFENRGTDMHEFNAAELFKASEIRNPDALNPDKTEIQVQPGEAKDLYFVPRKVGPFPLRCPDHDWAGMVGKITVE